MGISGMGTSGMGAPGSQGAGIVSCMHVTCSAGEQCNSTGNVCLDVWSSELTARIVPGYIDCMQCYLESLSVGAVLSIVCCM